MGREDKIWVKPKACSTCKHIKRLEDSYGRYWFECEIDGVEIEGNDCCNKYEGTAGEPIKTEKGEG